MRECLEETGVALRPGECIGEGTPCAIEFVDHHQRRVRKTIHPVVFRAMDGGEARPVEERVLFAGYMDIEAFLRDCAYDEVRAMLRQALTL